MVRPGDRDADADRAATSGTEYRLRLYVVGNLPNSVQAQANLRRICDEHLPGICDVEIVDFLDEPARALRDRVLVTPTLVKLSPGPRRTIVGTLAERAEVLRALEIPELDDEGARA